MPLLIAFDLDGTLVDSRRDLARSTNQMLVEHGATPLEEAVIVRMVGEGARELVKRACAAAGLVDVPRGAHDRFLQIYDDHLLDDTRPYPGIPALLTRLFSVASLAVLTNKPLDATRRVLEGLDLASFFDGVIGGDGPCGRKPESAGLAFLMERAATTPEATWLVGDSEIDLQTARNAGTRICLARYGFGFPRIAAARLDGRERFIDAPSDFLEVLASEGVGTA